MLNLLSRINSYMTNNMYGHGRYLLELERFDQQSSKGDRLRGRHQNTRCSNVAAD